jgi:hypothetical protein
VPLFPPQSRATCTHRVARTRYAADGSMGQLSHQAYPWVDAARGCPRLPLQHGPTYCRPPHRPRAAWRGRWGGQGPPNQTPQICFIKEAGCAAQSIDRLARSQRAYGPAGCHSSTPAYRAVGLLTSGHGLLASVPFPGPGQRHACCWPMSGHATP